MKKSHLDDDRDLQLLGEFYNDHPLAVIWLKPVWDNHGQTIKDFEYTYANEEGLRYLRLTREQCNELRLSTTPTLTDTLREAILKEMAQVLQTGKKSETTFFNQALNKYVHVLRTSLRGGVLTIVKDLTQENYVTRQLEQQTREVQAQQSLLDNILKHSSNGISVGEVVRDSSGKIVDFRTILANDAACRFTGIPKERYLTKTGGELQPGFIGSPYFQQCVTCMETGEPFITQYFFEELRRWLEVSVSKMDEEHQIYIFTDVTTIKEAQLATERSALQLQTIINRSQSGVFTISPVRNEQEEITDFRFVLVNRALAAYVNQEPEALVGTTGSTWFTAYKTNGLFDLFLHTYNTGKMSRFDFHYNADGIDAWIDMMCTRFDNEVLVTFTDYTPVKKLQLELQIKVEELKRSNESLEEFAYAASHDLQEPLRKIQTFADRLRDELSAQLSNVQLQMFERMENASFRMRTLIDDLLAYAQVSKQSAEAKKVDLNKVVATVLQDLEASIVETGAMVRRENLAVIKGSEQQFRQMFQNLIGNAIKYRKPGVAPEISISCSVVQGKETESILLPEAAGKAYYKLEVTDNGIGFEQQYAENIFQVFHRLHGRTEYEGSGVGLAIVKRVVENHRGYIRAMGEPGKGAAFIIFLPCSTED